MKNIWLWNLNVIVIHHAGLVHRLVEAMLKFGLAGRGCEIEVAVGNVLDAVAGEGRSRDQDGSGCGGECEGLGHAASRFGTGGCGAAHLCGEGAEVKGFRGFAER